MLARRRHCKAHVRVLVVDDDLAFADALHHHLREEPGILVVGHAGDGAEGVERAAALRPDVVLMDLAMPRLDGLEATRLIRSRFRAVRVLVLTASADPADEERARRAGAAAFIRKERAFEALVDAIHDVARPTVHRFRPRSRLMASLSS